MHGRLATLLLLLMMAHSAVCLEKDETNNIVTWTLVGVNYFFDIIQYMLLFVGFFYLLQKIREESTERAKIFLSSASSAMNLPAVDPAIPVAIGEAKEEASSNFYSDIETQNGDWIPMRSMASIRSNQLQNNPNLQTSTVTVETREQSNAVETGGAPKLISVGVETEPVKVSIGVQVDMAICVSYSSDWPAKRHSHPLVQVLPKRLEDDPVVQAHPASTSELAVSPQEPRPLDAVDRDVRVLTECIVLRNGNANSTSESEPVTEVGSASTTTTTTARLKKQHFMPVTRSVSTPMEARVETGLRDDDYSTVADALALADGQRVVVTKKASFSSQKAGLPRRQLMLDSADYCEVVYDEDRQSMMKGGGKVRRSCSIPRTHNLHRDESARLKYRAASMRTSCKMLTEGGGGRFPIRHPEDSLPAPPPPSVSSVSAADLGEKEGTPFTEVDAQANQYASRVPPKPPVRTNSLPSVRMNTVEPPPLSPQGKKQPPAIPPKSVSSRPSSRVQSPLPSPPLSPSSASEVFLSNPAIPAGSNAVGAVPRSRPATASPVERNGGGGGGPFNFFGSGISRASTEYTFVNFSKKKKNRKPGDEEELQGPPSRYTVDPAPRPTSPLQPLPPLSRPPGRVAEYEVVDLVLPPSRTPTGGSSSSAVGPGGRHVYEETDLKSPFDRRPRSYTPVASPVRKNVLPI